MDLKTFEQADKTMILSPFGAEKEGKYESNKHYMG